MTNPPDPAVVRSLELGRGARVKRWGVRLAVLVILAAAIGLLVRRVRSRGGAATRYVTAMVTRGEIRTSVTATGRLAASTSVEVGAEVSGRIIALHAAANDRVKQGQVLAEIDPEQLRAALDQARAQAQVAHANAQQAAATRSETKQIAERNAVLAAQNLLSQQAIESARATADRAEAAHTAALANARLADASIAQARSRLDKATIRAPIDGVVLDRLVELGQTVTAGFSTPILFKLADDLRHLNLTVDVDEADIGTIREGQEASFTVDAYPQRVFHSRVKSVRNEPTIAQNVVTYEVLLDVDNADLSLKPGMTVSSTIVTDVRAGVLRLPEAALRFVPTGATKLDGTRVWLDGPLRSVAVTVGSSDGTHREVRGGITEGTAVIIEEAPP